MQHISYISIGSNLGNRILNCEIAVRRLSEFCKVLIVNSGNANAHTGTKGLKEISKYAKIISKIFNCKIMI